MVVYCDIVEVALIPRELAAREPSVRVWLSCGQIATVVQTSGRRGVRVFCPRCTRRAVRAAVLEAEREARERRIRQAIDREHERTTGLHQELLEVLPSSWDNPVYRCSMLGAYDRFGRRRRVGSRDWGDE